LLLSALCRATKERFFNSFFFDRCFGRRLHNPQLAVPAHRLPEKMAVTNEEFKIYHRDGYIYKRRLFSGVNLAPLLYSRRITDEF
jgi:hypothetical protein